MRSNHTQSFFRPVAASPSVRLLNTMIEEEAKHRRVERGKRRLYFREDNGKANLASLGEKALWRKLVSVPAPMSIISDMNPDHVLSQGSGLRLAFFLRLCFSLKELRH